MAHPTLFYVEAGSGSIEVDFRSYPDWHDKLIFLEKGQYIRFMSPSFITQKLTFEDSTILSNQEGRVLFKHLISLGFVHCERGSNRKSGIPGYLQRSPDKIIGQSILDWYQQNPFKASRSEYEIIFDVKEMIDYQYKDRPGVDSITDAVAIDRNYVDQLFRRKIGMSIKQLVMKKQLDAAKKEIAFTDKAIHHVAYDLGYRDPGYFNRIFKKREGITPSEFREAIEYTIEDDFEERLFRLISKYHTRFKTNAFYAKQLHMSEKTLGRKVHNRLGTSLGSLIRNEVVRTAKKYLVEEVKIRDIAFTLGFDEPNHFTTFFKRYTGVTPTCYRKKSTR